MHAEPQLTLLCKSLQNVWSIIIGCHITSDQVTSFIANKLWQKCHYIVLCCNWKNTWVMEPRWESRIGHSYYHAQRSTGGSLCFPSLKPRANSAKVQNRSPSYKLDRKMIWRVMGMDCGWHCDLLPTAISVVSPTEIKISLLQLLRMFPTDSRHQLSSSF